MAFSSYFTCLFACTLARFALSQDATVVYRLMEELSSRHYIGSVAIDSQLFNDISNEEFQSVQFQIIKEQNNYATYFEIESETGLLWTSNVIDREEFDQCSLECIMDFNVAVYEMIELTKIIKVKINIEDANDNAPAFLPINNPIKVSESVGINSVIITGAAIDLDKSESNSVNTYILLPEVDPPVFKIVVTESKEFELVNNAELDRETLSEYQLVVLAVDGGDVPLTGTTTIDIVVTDANDNVPAFTEESYTISIDENTATDKVFLHISSTDPDLDINGKVMYTFSNRVSDKIFELFYINPNSGELSVVGTIDYESNKQFNIQVAAYDLGVPSLTSTTNVLIDIIDANDNAPVINLHQPPGGTTLLESVKIGTFIAHVEVVDIDSGDNGHVVCNIPDSTFKLEEISIGGNYKINLNQSLDYETKRQYNVTFICEDRGDPPHRTVASFIMRIEDVNDNVPVFTESVYSVKVTENNEINITIIQISATDADSGVNGQVYYRLHNESNGLFAIDNETGVITVNENLDRETLGDQYLLLILAIDSGETAQTSTGTVLIDIKDLNDNDPLFDKNPMEFYVSENILVGSEVGNISVFDPDKGENGTVQLLFPVDEDISEHFIFEQDGRIRVREVLDRESIAVYSLYAFAVDMGGRTSSAEVNIFVTDMNDNKPEVIYPNEYDNTINVPASLSEDSLVLHIETRDYDTGDNAKLHFTMRSDNSSGVFTLDHESGEMYLNSSVDDSVGVTYTLDIDITDGGNPPLNTSISINFKIIIAVSYSEALAAGMTVNLWIVLGIVILTVVLSTTMIIIILKTCWKDRHGRRKRNCLSEGSAGSDRSDERFLDSLSSHSNAVSDPEDAVKDKDMYLELKIDDRLKSYSGSLNETGYMTYSSSTSVFEHIDTEQTNNMHMKSIGGLTKMPSYERHGEKYIDNCGMIQNEGYTRPTTSSTVSGLYHDLGDVDNEITMDDVTDSDSVFYPANINSDTNNSHKISDKFSDKYSDTKSDKFSDKFSDKNSEKGKLSKSLPIFTINQQKVAAKKELCRIYKIQKKVMFSDDLEHGDLDDLSKSLPAHTGSKLFNDAKLHRINSEHLLNRYDYPKPIDKDSGSCDHSRYWNNTSDHYSRNQSTSSAGTDIVNWPIDYNEVDV